MALRTHPRGGRALLLASCPALLAAWWLTSAGAVPPGTKAAPPSAARVDFARDIRPILSESCFACHGPDDKARKAKLRLDTKDGAFGPLRSGGRAVVPGKAAESELVARITNADASEQMPPPKSGKKLTPRQVALLKQWVEQGAPWSTHWAFDPPRLPALPQVADAAWPRNPIDHFILARLEKEGLKPSPEADRVALLRRVTLDLTGLPPTPAEVDAFLADRSPSAYEKVVDRLLKSPRYGEHMARFWLDAARYGDTHGLHLDNYREIWPYRDWVIGAFNGNLPFDRFVVEQLAGDLLPNATLDQQVATGFNRCHVTTNEGGSIDEEVYVRNVVDRVDTTGTVFLGLTVGCARCHDHRYDPVRMKDYYQLFAFFNSIDGSAMDGNSARPAPVARVPNAEQAKALALLDLKSEALRKEIAEEVALIRYDEPADVKAPEAQPRAEYVWIDDGLPAGVKEIIGSGPNVRWAFGGGRGHPVFSGEKSLKLTAKGVTQNVLVEASPGLSVGVGDKLFAYVYLDPSNTPKEIMLQWHTDTWKHRAYWGENRIPFGRDNSPERLRLGPLPASAKWVRLEVDAERVGLKPGMVITGWAFTQYGGTAYWDKAGLVTQVPQGGQPFDSLAAWLRVQRATGGAGLPKGVQDLVKLDPAKRTAAQHKELRDYFLANAYAKARAIFAPLHRQLGAVEKERAQLDKQIPATLVFKERAQPRPAYILKRGEYDQRGDRVERDTPAFLPPLPAGAPRNRLGFARWLVAPEHPLTARVAVNRFWQQFFGTGLVKTAEDFGSQGTPPTHPELLDWLAVQFREDGWDVKKAVKRLVMSATYRQSARVPRDRLAKDPDNRLLSRGPRFRLDAETLRDQALFVSGLLVEKVGGPSVRPPQPSGLWEAVAFTGSNTGKFVADKGHEKVHRRSLYTFWKRTSHPPQMGTLDAPSREACTVRRERTNTPLQALLLMNERLFVEASRALAERTLREAGGDPGARLRHLFGLATARAPDEVEMGILRDTLAEHLARFRADPKAAQQLIRVGETAPSTATNAEELAAWTMVGNLVLNLDEVINR
jgi:mono/diheme cytochrome c family protein